MSDYPDYTDYGEDFHVRPRQPAPAPEQAEP